MLVLSRKAGESILIAENIEVFVVEVRHGKVKLGIRCADEVPILRREVYDRKTTDERTLLNRLTESVGG